jgi:hypothetical protein
VWPLTLRERQALRMLRSVLRRRFGPKTEEVTEGLRERDMYHNDELPNFYCSHDITKVVKTMRMR